MSNVFNFEPRAAQSKKTDFLRGANDTLEFDEKEGGVSSLKLPTGAGYHDKDWSNQELADLYRVKRMLDAAGVSIEVERGLTDEGDPWFLFINAHGEVFVHLCRLDGLYILDSPNVSEPLTGYDFNSLIHNFSNRAIPQTDGAQASGHRVVRLERNGKLFLHPSALMAALIWTLFVAAEELVIVIPEEEDIDNADLHTLFGENAELVASQDTQDRQIFATHENNLASHDDAAAKEDLAGSLDHREFGAKFVASQNIYVMGLNAIAIALGYVSETSFTENQAADFASFTGSFEQLEEGSSGDEKHRTAQDADEFIGMDQRDGQVILASVLDEETVKEESQTSDEDVVFASASNVTVDQSEDDIEVDNFLDLSLEENRPPDLSEENADFVEAKKYAVVSQPQDVSLYEDLNDALLKDLDVFDLSHVFSGEVFEFKLGQVTVQATFDLAKADFIDFEKTFLESPTQEVSKDVIFESVKYENFDNEARNFVDFVLSKSTDFELISLGNEVLIIDSAIFDTPGVTTYALSWSLGDDSGVVSMIGLRSEFQEFDLVV